MIKNEIIVGKIDTQLGTFGAVITPKGLARLVLPSEPLDSCEEWVQRWEPEARIVPDDGRLQHLTEQLNAYSLGELKVFDVPVDLRGTDFQVEVWNALKAIRYSEVWSYGQLAAFMGKPSAVRAVGAANGANPVPVIIPCHRVIGSTGQLVGYGGGLDMKRRLLELEGVLFSPSARVAETVQGELIPA